MNRYGSNKPRTVIIPAQDLSASRNAMPQLQTSTIPNSQNLNQPQRPQTSLSTHNITNASRATNTIAPFSSNSTLPTSTPYTNLSSTTRAESLSNPFLNFRYSINNEPRPTPDLQ